MLALAAAFAVTACSGTDTEPRSDTIATTTTTVPTTAPPEAPAEGTLDTIDYSGIADIPDFLTFWDKLTEAAMRGLSQGRATCTMEPSHYGPAPPEVAASFM